MGLLSKVERVVVSCCLHTLIRVGLLAVDHCFVFLQMQFLFAKCCEGENCKTKCQALAQKNIAVLSYLSFHFFNFLALSTIGSAVMDHNLFRHCLWFGNF